MAFVHGKHTRVLANEFDLSAYLNNTDMSWDVDTPETTIYGSDDRTYITGLRNSTMSFSGFWDGSSAITVDPVVAADLAQTAVVLVTYGPDGLTQGDITYSLQSRYTNYSVGSPVDGVVTVALDVQGTGKLSRGISLHDLTAVTSDGNGDPYDLGATSTSAACLGYLHITAITLPATESLSVAVQDSATSTPGSWTDLLAFTDITCSVKASQRLAAPYTVDRYVRSEWQFLTSASTGCSATFAIAFESPTTGPA